MAEKESDKKELLDSAEISLILDTYDDIFSDFDPRPFSQRALSDDFIAEAKRAALDKEEKIELRFMMPHDKRDLSTETMIRKRLKEHFRKKLEEKIKTKTKLIRKGSYFGISGLVLMFLAAVVLLKMKDTSLLTSLLIVLLEPAGWFLFWEGLNLIVFDVEEKVPNLDFYKKMSRAEVSFISY